jgi:hypothetical protein
MLVSRGGFLRTCVAMGVGRSLQPLSWLSMSASPSPARAAVSTSGAFRLEDASPAAFRPYLRTTLSVEVADGVRVPLRVSAVSDVRSHGPFEHFSVMFQAPSGTNVPQNTYRVQHAVLGSFDLFIVPVGGGDGPQVCEACFSRRVPGA